MLEFVISKKHFPKYFSSNTIYEIQTSKDFNWCIFMTFLV